MGGRETTRRQLKVAFITMMKGAEDVDYEGLDVEAGFEGWRTTKRAHHPSCAGFIIPKDVHSVKRELARRWRETLNAAHVIRV